MSMLNPFQKLLWTATLGGLAGLGLGCVISVGPLDCSECGNTGCNSQQVGDSCLCDSGYEFANDDPNDFDCDRIPGKGGDANCGGEANVHLEGQVCVCDSGYNWCNPNDDDDLSCCEDDMQVDPTGTATDSGPTSETDGDTDDPTDDTADDTADSTGDPDTCEQVESPWNGVEPDDAECTEDGLVYCSNNDIEGPAGSRYWECSGGMWVENLTAGDESCQFDNYDFAYGCVDDGTSVTFVCGTGPGTPCSGPECNGCADDDVIQFCSDGKLGSDSCNRICTMVGDADGITYDFGFCVDEANECACCDEGEKDCPI